MTCSPQTSAAPIGQSPEDVRFRTRVARLFEELGCEPPLGLAAAPAGDAAVATALMDAYRRTGDRQVFDCLADWVGPQLRARVRSRLRSLGALLDPNEVWQDAIVNIYRYPDRFLASRPGAFAAWSSTIVDNVIRRQLRCTRRDSGMHVRDPELLATEADGSAREPSATAVEREELAATAGAFRLLLAAYLVSFRRLGERERFVLEMVEVRRMRYAELAMVLGIRAEALKMVVFRARKRVFDRMREMMAPGAEVEPAPAASCRVA